MNHDRHSEEADLARLFSLEDFCQLSNSNDFISNLNLNRLSAVSLLKSLETDKGNFKKKEEITTNVKKKERGTPPTPPLKPEHLRGNGRVALIASKPPYATLKPQRMSMIAKSLFDISTAIVVPSNNAVYSQSANKPLALLSQPRRRCMSTSTLQVDTKLVQADLIRTLRCLAAFIEKRVAHEASKQLNTAPELSETLYPLSLKHPLNKTPVTADAIFEFLHIVFKEADIVAECAVIALIYIERFLKNSSHLFCADNWLRIVLGGLILASKVWDDHAVWNVDFCEIFPESKIAHFTLLEKYFLDKINFDISVDASTYAQLYFKLRLAAVDDNSEEPIRKSFSFL